MIIDSCEPIYDYVPQDNYSSSQQSLRISRMHAHTIAASYRNAFMSCYVNFIYYSSCREAKINQVTRDYRRMTICLHICSPFACNYALPVCSRVSGHCGNIEYAICIYPSLRYGIHYKPNDSINLESTLHCWMTDFHCLWSLKATQVKSSNMKFGIFLVAESLCRSGATHIAARFQPNWTIQK